MHESHFSQICERLSKDPGLPVSNPTTSYWQEPPSERIANVRSHELPKEVDIIIIGSGITGCSIAKHLLENDSNLRVTVLEARTICSGATGRNGGNIKAVPELTYQSLPEEDGQEAVKFQLGNVEAMMALNETLPDDLKGYGEVRRVETMNVFTTDEGFAKMKEAKEKFDGGFEEFRGRGWLVEQPELREKYGIANAVGAYLASAGAAWPYRLITGMFAHMLQQHKDRFSIESRTPAEKIDYANNGTYTVHTPRGSIQAKTVIHATNGHAGHLLPSLRGPLFPVRGQMTTHTPTDIALKHTGVRSWSLTYDNGFDYIIQSPSTKEIFAGGGLAQAFDHGLSELGNVSDDVQSTLPLAHLGGAMNAVFGLEQDTAMTKGVKAAWTGIMGFTSDGLPLIGALPGEVTGRDGKGEWIAAGFNGYGMVNTWLSGKHVAERVLGKDKPEPIPRCYEFTLDRFKRMSAEKSLQAWIEALGLE